VKSGLAIGLALIATAASAQEGVDVRPQAGAWRQDYSISFTKLDGQQLPEPETAKETVTDCYTESDFADFGATLFVGAEDDCVGSDFVMGEGKLSLFVRCDFGPGKAFAGQVQGTYAQTHFEIASVLATEGEARSELVAKVRATWVGTCATSS